MANRYGTTVHATCTWGNGPDILVTVSQQMHDQLPPKVSSFDLDVASALGLIASLERAIQDVDLAEVAFEEHCQRLDTSRGFEDIAGGEDYDAEATYG